MRRTFINLKLFVAETIVAINLLFLPVCHSEVKQEPSLKRN